MDAISTDYHDIDDVVTLYNHIPMKITTSGKMRYIESICGVTIHEDRILWYDGLQSVDCPDCLLIVAIGKSARIGRGRLPDWHELDEAIPA